MKLTHTLAVAIVVSFAVPALSQAQGQTKPADKSTVQAQKAAPAQKKAEDPAAALPTPILDAFKKAYPNAVIKNAAKETEGGKTVWEVESTDNGLARDLVYNPDGTVVDIEEEVPPASLPPAVTAALKAKFPKAAITKAEKKTTGKVLTYEMTITGAGKVTSAEFTPEGKFVPPSKEEKEEKEDDAKPVVKKK